MRVLRLHQLQRQLVRRANVTKPTAVTINTNIAASARTGSALGRSVRFQSNRALSSFAEPEQTLFHTSRPKITEEYSELDKQLRSDVKTMGSILGKLVYEQYICLSVLKIPF